LAALTLLSFAAAPGGAWAEGLLLRLASSKEPRIYRTEITIRQRQTVAGVEFNTELTTTTVAEWTFQHVDQDGNLHWQSHNKQLQVRGTIGFLGEFRFDSTTKDRAQGSQLDAALVPVYTALSDATFEVTLNPRGQVVAVTGFDGFIAPLVKDDVFAMQYTFGGTDKGAALVYQEQFVVFSDAPVAPGGTWSVPYDWQLPALGRVTGTKSFTLRNQMEQAGRGVADLDVTYALSVEADMKASGLHTTGTITTRDFKGTAKVDTASGQILSMDSAVTLTGTVSIDIGGATYAVPTEQRWNVAVEKLDALPGNN
jgi:hypothetical protein